MAVRRDRISVANARAKSLFAMVGVKVLRTHYRVYTPWCAGSLGYHRFSHAATRIASLVRDAGERNLHSQATVTRHPWRVNALICRVSRSTFAANFSCQNNLFDFGV